MLSNKLYWLALIILLCFNSWLIKSLVSLLEILSKVGVKLLSREQAAHPALDNIKLLPSISKFSIYNKLEWGWNKK